MKRYQMSESLPVGLLLALAGGILDSYTYLNRGQVFATAETGNLVLLGIHLAQGELGRVLSCLFPILAFALGVLTTEGLRRRLSSGRVHWRQPILAAECLVILVVSFLPQGDLDALANVLIAFTSAIQIESFRKFAGCGCATTMCTGNLRSGTERLYQFLRSGNPEQRRQAGQYYGIILCFILGAALGAWVSSLLAERAVLIACVLLLAAFLMMFWNMEDPCAEEAEGSREKTR